MPLGHMGNPLFLRRRVRSALRAPEMKGPPNISHQYLSPLEPYGWGEGRKERDIGEGVRDAEHPVTRIALIRGERPLPGPGEHHRGR